MRYNEIRRKAVSAIASKEIGNCGRWCEITMRNTGTVLKIVRTGYGAMERPETDGHEILINGEVIANCKDLYEAADFILTYKG